MTLVKICGLTNKEDAEAAMKAGADFLGLIFVEKSKRYVDMDTARSIAQHVHSLSRTHASQTANHTSNWVRPPYTHPSIPANCTTATTTWFQATANQLLHYRHQFPRPLLVGVFQNQSVSFIHQCILHVPLDAVQLHGQEPVDYFSESPVSVPILRCIGVTKETTVHELRHTIHQYVGQVDLILLDTQLSSTNTNTIHTSTTTTNTNTSNTDITNTTNTNSTNTNTTTTNSTIINGGTGQMFNHQLVRSLHPLPLMIAGGLNPTTLPSVLLECSTNTNTNSVGVDVASGVEVPGNARKKDAVLMVDFVNRVRAFDRDVHGMNHHLE